jgi:hypothetical protein
MPSAEALARMLAMMRANPAPPDSREARLLAAYDALTMEHDGLAREVERLREANAAQAQALGLYNIERGFDETKEAWREEGIFE